MNDRARYKTFGEVMIKCILIGALVLVVLIGAVIYAIITGWSNHG